MRFSAHSLHSPVIVLPEQQATVGARVASILADQRRIIEQALVQPAMGDSIQIPLTTVSLDSNFDAYVNIGFRGGRNRPSTTLLVDSGNSTLIVPSWDDIAALPNSAKNYTVLGTAKEPWESKANIVRGPIEIATATGGIYTIENCVFYACTEKPGTANFGVGCIRPWSADGWNTPKGIGVTLQAPLSYDTLYPYAAFDYAPAENVLPGEATPNVTAGSSLVLYKSPPPGYKMLDITPNLEWMSVVPKALSIGNAKTGWPGSVESPIAMVDTGGGPVFLTDPNGYVYNLAWPASTTCPLWTSKSTDCQCTGANITVELTDGTNSISYIIDTDRLPPTVRGLTLVMCKVNSYMMGMQGMNIGGISALFNSILIDYLNGRVGFRSK
ncbi:MAG: hypothetical protein JOZ08_00910 [Verrucomicrobia bacterium]|nr:hypothetical protein [Verrucomicrobiota bacterium]MBV8274118.1 hypothetical protein [Verrucomicrobiota bacterium]